MDGSVEKSYKKMTTEEFLAKIKEDFEALTVNDQIDVAEKLTKIAKGEDSFEEEEKEEEPTE